MAIRIIRIRLQIQRGEAAASSGSVNLQIRIRINVCVIGQQIAAMLAGRVHGIGIRAARGGGGGIGADADVLVFAHMRRIIFGSWRPIRAIKENVECRRYRTRSTDARRTQLNVEAVDIVIVFPGITGSPVQAALHIGIIGIAAVLTYG